MQEVLYEIDMLVNVPKLPFENYFVRNAFLESRLLHTRNLMDFFERKKRTTRRGKLPRSAVENDDVLASDYNFPLAGQDIGISKFDKERLNKALAHITYERITYRSQHNMVWPYDTTLRPVLLVCQKFLEHLRDGFLKDQEGEDKETVIRLLSEIDAGLQPKQSLQFHNVVAATTAGHI